MVSLQDFFKDSKCIFEFNIGTYTIDNFDKADQSIKIKTEKGITLNKITIISKHNNTKKISYQAYIDFIYDYETTEIINNKITINKFDHNFFNSSVTMYFIFNHNNEYFKTYQFLEIK